MTKCVVLGEDNQEEKKLKPIEFVFRDGGNLSVGRVKPSLMPSNWKNIELVSRSNNKYKCYDIMFAYDNDRSRGVIYFGWWNDGVPE